MLLTIVIAAYNVQEYLPNALDSLVLQPGLEQLQVILVNDGSTDNTPSVCHSYQQRYPQQIRVIDQANAGLGAARNAGLMQVETPYVAFLDGDDWYQEGFAAKVCAFLDKEKQCDILLLLPCIFDMETKQYKDWYDREKLEQIHAAYPDQPFNAESCPELFSLQCSCCSRVFRTAFLRENNFCFPQGVLWEDVQPHFFLMDRAKTCRTFLETGFVYQRNRPGQITTSPSSSGSDLAKVYHAVFHDAADWSLEKKAYIYERLFDTARWRCRVANHKQRSELLTALRALYHSLPQQELNLFLNNPPFEPSAKRRLLNKAIRHGSRTLNLAYSGINWLRAIRKKVKP